MTIRIERLSEANFKDYESLTSCESGGGCYCSFWHQKCKKETPDLNRSIVYEKMRSGFHVGILAYQDKKLLAWVSVGPLIDFYWTWKRVVQVGEAAQHIAGITCFTLAPDFRGQGLQASVLEELKVYGKEQKWKAIEAYPFDPSALEKHKEHVIWPGLTKGYIEAGFNRVGPHWLTNADAERSIYRCDLT